uniref:Uncharacterized protein n=1 Tax=Solanum tuberosum TaxID=4113 RepID=M1E045_SOLTU
MHKFEQNRRFIQFLMRLNEVYCNTPYSKQTKNAEFEKFQAQVLSIQITLRSVPDLQFSLQQWSRVRVLEAFFLLIQEEKQREFKPATRMPMDSTSLSVNSTNNNNRGVGRACRINFSTENGNSGGNNNRCVIICEFCKKQRHTKEKCYKLHGYPPGNNILNHRQVNHNNGQQSRKNNHQNLKGRRVVANAHGTTPDHGEECSQTSNNSNAVITQEQYGQIMNLLQHFQIDG